MLFWAYLNARINSQSVGALAYKTWIFYTTSLLESVLPNFCSSILMSKISKIVLADKQGMANISSYKNDANRGPVLGAGNWNNSHCCQINLYLCLIITLTLCICFTLIIVLLYLLHLKVHHPEVSLINESFCGNWSLHRLGNTDRSQFRGRRDQKDTAEDSQPSPEIERKLSVSDQSDFETDLFDKNIEFQKGYSPIRLTYAGTSSSLSVMVHYGSETTISSPSLSIKPKDTSIPESHRERDETLWSFNILSQNIELPVIKKYRWSSFPGINNLNKTETDIQSGSTIVSWFSASSRL